MDTLAAIAARRSIRRFKDEEIDRDTIARLLEAAVLAPSGKNQQPWRFIVLTEDARTHLTELMEAACEAIVSQGGQAGSAPATAATIRQTPVTVVVFETPIPEEWKVWEAGVRLVDAQSIGAAIQNICLAATDAGLGSLWIADVLYAEDAITKWLGQPEEKLVAAVSIGHPNESPDARPRKPFGEAVVWRSGLE